ncbi:MAG: nucleoside triphosphate pyrophosphohydrolase [Pseudomonadota bacterium]|nr:nucleoside triphosphate pyrophosphohydrolase [Pseudomonadota bacterium]
MKKQIYKRHLDKLLESMERLRDQIEGSSWDQNQTLESIAPYTLEEAYEVVDAIERKDFHNLTEELGDLLYQVVYQSQIAKEMNLFDFGDVAEAIYKKLVRRHPDFFSELEKNLIKSNSNECELTKDSERSRKSGGLLSSIPRALPGLTRSFKLGRRAAEVGFDWADAAEVRQKVSEEIAELDEAIDTGNDEAIAAEMGDLFISLANLSRHLGLDPESCVRGANDRFEHRFQRIEDRVNKEDGGWEAQDTVSLERLWQQAKTGTHM